MTASPAVTPTRAVSQRPRLFGLAYRLLGSRSDAEDVLQDAWLRWQASDRAAIRDPEAWLVPTPGSGWTGCAQRAAPAFTTPARGCPSRWRSPRTPIRPRATRAPSRYRWRSWRCWNGWVRTSAPRSC
ncbi:sigma factor [Xanthomonas graminis]|uniref:sigma factor n=1 Tax=Xanthomonas graminis TaxID=3390026 RepID=UPI00396488EA